MLGFVRIFRFSTQRHAPVLILGGGSGGLNVSAQLVKDKHLHPHQITVVEPKGLHAYQPAWTMVGGGFFDVQDTLKPNKQVFNKRVDLAQQKATKIDPENNKVVLEDGTIYTYEQLVVALGLKLDFQQIKGAQEALDDPNCPVATIYDSRYATKMDKLVQNFKGGKAIFTEPQLPIKCAGAPQKILYITHDRITSKNIKTEFDFHKTINVIFGVQKYAKILEGVAKDKGINVIYKSKLVEVRGKDRIAVFENQDTKERIEKHFDLLHLVPPQVPVSLIKESGLGDEQGFVSINKFTLQHTKFPNVWSLGDCSNLPTSKTAAAIMSQTPILNNNMVRNWKQESSMKELQYEGYTSCPIFVSRNKLLLAEFKYDGVLDETFGGYLQSHPNYLMALMKKHLFPFCYWQFMARGVWGGRDGLRISKIQ